MGEDGLGGFGGFSLKEGNSERRDVVQKKRKGL